MLRVFMAHRKCRLEDAGENEIRTYIDESLDSAAARTQARRLSWLCVSFFIFFVLITTARMTQAAVLIRPCKLGRSLPKYLSISEVGTLVQRRASHPWI